ncbi:MAG: DUF748 domain-containing protein [bacterium]|nr:DUF748 domain-containing protein [bacterium]
MSGSEPPSRWRLWRRRLLRIGLVLIALLVLIRVTIPLWLPPTLDRLVAGRGLALAYDDLDLSVAGGRLDLRGVRLSPRPEDEQQDDARPLPLVGLEYLGFDLDVSALLTGTVRVHRVDVDGLRIEIERDASGRWNFEDHLPAADSDEPAEADAESPTESSTREGAEEAAEPRPLDFGVPLELTALGVRSVRVHLIDALADPPLDTHIDLDVALTDVGHPTQPLRLSVAGWAPELLDALRVEVHATLGERTVDARIGVNVAGLHVRRLAPYLAAAGIRPEAKQLDLSLDVDVDLAPTGAETVDLAGSAHLRHLALRADLEEALALDAATIEVTSASTAAASVASVTLEGLRARAARLADGTLRVAGLDFVGTGAAPATEQAADAQEEPSSGGAPFALDVARLALRKAALTFDDAAVTPAVVVQASIGAEVRELVLDRARPGAPLTFETELELEDAARLTLTGTAVPTGDRLGADLTLEADNLTLRRLEPYLTAAGLEPAVESATFRAAVTAQTLRRDDGGLDANVALTNVQLVDGGRELFAIDRLGVDDVQFAADGEIHVGELGLAGTRVPLRVVGDGSVELCGVTTHPTRAATHEPLALGLDELALSVRDFRFGGESASAARRSADVELSLVAEGLARACTITGSITTRPGPLDIDADLEIVGRGLRTEAVDALLAAAGIESTLTDGELRAHLVAAARQDGDDLHARLALTDVAFGDGGRELLALDALEVEELVVAPDRTSIASVAVRSPRAALGRGADGAFEVLGLRLVGADPSAEADASAPTPQQPQAAPAEPGRAPAPFDLDHLVLEGARVTWSDAAAEPAVETALTLGATVDGLTTERGARPLTLDVRSSIEGALDELALTGTAQLDPDDLGLDAQLALSGLRAGPLASYVPPELPILLEDGRFELQIEASSAAHPEGGRAASLAISGLDYRDGSAGEPLIAFDALRVEAPRLDAENGVYDVERVTLEGFAFEVRRVSPERIETLGIALDSSLRRPEPTPAATPEPDPASAAPTVPTGDASAAVGASTPPTIRLGAFDVGIDRLRYSDATHPDAVPLDLSLALVTPGPQMLCAPEPDALPPLEIALVGKVAPLVDSIEARLRAAPFHAEPELFLDFGVRGVRGAELERTLPEVAAAIDASALAAGEFTARAEARLRMPRRGPIDFDLERGFGAEITVSDVALRPEPEADVLAGFERLDIDVQRVRPTTGDVHFSAIELTGTRARIVQEPEGMRVAGVLLRTPPPTGEEPAAPESPVETETEAEPDVESVPPVEPAPAGEIKIDRLLISGLDFDFLDTTVTPSTHLPIADLEVEVRRFTTRGFTEARPFSFRAIVDAGEVELPERTGADNLLAGVVGSVASAVSGGGDEFETESRRIWDLLEIGGRMSLAPELRGRVRLSLVGLELPAFRGAATAGGVDIGDGLVDTRLDLRFRDDGALGIDSKTTCDYLSLSEPSNGPISQYLALPAPLDTVLFLLRDEAGRQSIPLRLEVAEGGVGGGQIASAVGTALGTLVADSLAGAPLRMLGPLTDVVGITGGESTPITAESIALPYVPGSAVLDRETLDKIDPIVEALRADTRMRIVVQHELGTGDVAAAEVLANPRPEEGEEIVTRLRDRKAAIERERGEVAALTRAQYAVGLLEEAAAGTTALKVLDRERAAVEAALDRIFELLGPGAERRRDRRTREASLALAQERVDRLRAAIVARGGVAVALRIDARRPRFAVSEEPGGRVTLTPRLPK